MKWKENKWKVLSASIVLILLIAGTYVATADTGGKLTNTELSMPERKAIPVDKEDWPKNWEEVKTHDELARFFEMRYPFLMMAKEKGVTTQPDVSLTLDGLEGRVQVEEVWHRGPRLVFLYSIDLSLLIADEKDKDYAFINKGIQLQNISIKGNDLVEEQELQAIGLFEPGMAVVFENRLYGVIESSPVLNQAKDFTGFSIEEKFHHTLDTTLALQINGEVYETNAFPVEYKYIPEEQVVRTYEFEDTLTTDDATITPLYAEINLNQSFIKLKIDSEREIAPTIDAYLLAPTGERIVVAPYMLPVEGEDDVYKLFIHPLTPLEGDIILTINSIHFMEPVDTSFTVTIPEKGRVTSDEEKVVASILGTDLLLSHIQKDARNLEVGLTIDDTTESSFFANNQGVSDQAITFTTDNGESGTPFIGGFNEKLVINVPTRKIRDASTITFDFHKAALREPINHTFQ